VGDGWSAPGAVAASRVAAAPPGRIAALRRDARLHGSLLHLHVVGESAIKLFMTAIRTNAAAGILGVSPNTLRSWERRFGYPSPRRTQGGHRQYELAEVEALREAFAETHNISSAISLARARGEGPSTAARLQAALQRFDEAKADRLLEESLVLRSVERTVEEVLLPAVGALDGGDAPSPEHQFAWRYATGWLAAALRVAPAAHRLEGVLIFDASRPCDLDALHVQALELALRRAGMRTLTLGVDVDPARVGRAVRALDPAALVLTGHRAPLDALGRLVYAARAGERRVEVFDYRGALPDTGASTVRRLGDAPTTARDKLLDLFLPAAGGETAAEGATAPEKVLLAQAPARPARERGRPSPAAAVTRP
jgi:DNA-binding transcriptional MerR regulator